MEKRAKRAVASEAAAKPRRAAAAPKAKALPAAGKKKTAVAEKTRRKRRSPEEIRDRLLRAARDEFRQFGFVGATTAGIARTADVTEAQLFRYFESKSDLFREAVFEPLNEHFAAFNIRHHADVEDRATFREQTHLYIDELRTFLDEHSKLLLSLVVAQLFTSGSMKNVGEIDSLSAYFEQGAARMSLRSNRNLRVDPKLLVRVSFAGVLGCVIFKDWIFPSGSASDEEINAAIIDFVIDGLSGGSIDTTTAKPVPAGTTKRGKSKP